MSLGLQPPRPKKRRLSLRGGNGQAFLCVEPQSIVAGPRQTGKTVGQCMKVHKILSEHPNEQGIIARRVYKAMRDTVLRTYAGVSVGCGVKTYGGTSPNLFVYPNGSRLVAIGLDNPGNVLSGEYAFVYVNQAEELDESEWEMLGSSCTGRGTKYPHPQIFGDCNPSGSKHWILQRAKRGKLKLFESTHQDNPELYTAAGKITPEGERQMAILESMLSGVRRDRLLLGKWRTAEGCVYEDFDARVHARERSAAEMVRWGMGVDDGFTCPAVVLLIGEDPDGRMHVFEELYECKLKRSDVVERAKEMAQRRGANVSQVAIDTAAPELAKQFSDAGFAVGEFSKGRVQDTVRLVQDRLRVLADGKPRLTIDPCCENTLGEFGTYQYKKDSDDPEDENNHAMDALRYYCILRGVPTGAFSAADLARAVARPAGEEREERFVADRLGKDDF